MTTTTTDAALDAIRAGLERGLSLTRIANQCNLSTSTVNDIWHRRGNRAPTPATVDALRRHLDPNTIADPHDIGITRGFYRPDWPARESTIQAAGDAAPCMSAPAIWTSDDPDEQRAAAKLCTGCPAILTCRKAGEYEAGVWGGTTQEDRARARRKAKRT